MQSTGEKTSKSIQFNNMVVDIQPLLTLSGSINSARLLAISLAISVHLKLPSNPVIVALKVIVFHYFIFSPVSFVW